MGECYDRMEEHVERIRQQQWTFSESNSFAAYAPSEIIFNRVVGFGLILMKALT